MRIRVLPNTEYTDSDEAEIIGKELDVVQEYPNYYVVLYEPSWSEFGELSWYIKKNTAEILEG